MLLTAGFGEGHNSAARQLAKALGEESGGRVMPEPKDPVTLASPRLAAVAKRIYHDVTTRAPEVWRMAFELSRGGPFGPGLWDRVVGVQAWLERAMWELRPRAVVTTYPLYPYFLEAMPADVPRSERVWVVVTDSITIHPIWMRMRADGWLVTDEYSREYLIGEGMEAGRIEVTGFPVDPAYAVGRREAGELGRLRVLYFATTGTTHVRETVASLVRELPERAELTVVTGRSEARLRPVVESVVAASGRGGVRVEGWCGDIPARMAASDVVLTKAGGATVHECLAAGVPAVVNYVIPGQEEGNLELLERLGCGCRAPVAGGETGRFLRDLVSGGRLRAMQEAATRERRPDGAVLAARRILADTPGI
jgi:processive 1,2-diacylglycerol beta-glucosyltransferase